MFEANENELFGENSNYWKLIWSDSRSNRTKIIDSELTQTPQYFTHNFVLCAAMWYALLGLESNFPEKSTVIDTLRNMYFFTLSKKFISIACPQNTTIVIVFRSNGYVIPQNQIVAAYFRKLEQSCAVSGYACKLFKEDSDCKDAKWYAHAKSSTIAAIANKQLVKDGEYGYLSKYNALLGYMITAFLPVHYIEHRELLSFDQYLSYLKAHHDSQNNGFVTKTDFDLFASQTNHYLTWFNQAINVLDNRTNSMLDVSNVFIDSTANSPPPSQMMHQKITTLQNNNVMDINHISSAGPLNRDRCYYCKLQRGFPKPSAGDLVGMYSDGVGPPSLEAIFLSVVPAIPDSFEPPNAPPIRNGETPVLVTIVGMVPVRIPANIVLAIIKTREWVVCYNASSNEIELLDQFPSLTDHEEYIVIGLTRWDCTTLLPDGTARFQETDGVAVLIAPQIDHVNAMHGIRELYRNVKKISVNFQRWKGSIRFLLIILLILIGYLYYKGFNTINEVEKALQSKDQDDISKEALLPTENKLRNSYEPSMHHHVKQGQNSSAPGQKLRLRRSGKGKNDQLLSEKGLARSVVNDIELLIADVSSGEKPRMMKALRDSVNLSRQLKPFFPPYACIDDNSQRHYWSENVIYPHHGWIDQNNRNTDVIWWSARLALYQLHLLFAKFVGDQELQKQFLNTKSQLTPICFNPIMTYDEGALRAIENLSFDDWKIRALRDNVTFYLNYHMDLGLLPKLKVLLATNASY